MSARDEVLARVRAALSDVPGGETPLWEPPARGADPQGAPASEAQLVALLEERLTDYRAHVIRCDGEGEAIAKAVRDACERREVRSLVIAPGLPAGWAPAELSLLSDDPPLSLDELDAAGGVLTACAVAVAETGTIALDAGPGQGRRAITLLPDVHVCVVRAQQVVASVPQALAQLAIGVCEAGRPLTLISGPSATSDIELQRVEGVHGPRHLEVVLAG